MKFWSILKHPVGCNVATLFCSCCLHEYQLWSTSLKSPRRATLLGSSNCSLSLKTAMDSLEVFWDDEQNFSKSSSSILCLNDGSGRRWLATHTNSIWFTTALSCFSAPKCERYTLWYVWVCLVWHQMNHDKTLRGKCRLHVQSFDMNTT